MGEMADYYLEMMDQDDLEDGEYQFGLDIRCKYCKRYRFYWGYRDGVWRLYTVGTGRLHKCKAYGDGKKGFHR
jgi:hypothetical protein